MLDTLKERFPCERCGGDHGAIRCPNKVRRFRAGTKVRSTVNIMPNGKGRRGVIVKGKSNTIQVWLEWLEGPTGGRAERLIFPGWIKRI